MTSCGFARGPVIHTLITVRLYRYCTQAYTAATHSDAGTKQSDASICADLFTFASSGPIPYAPYQDIAEFLQWCVRKYISLISSVPSP